MERFKEIEAEVRKRNVPWDAYDQGRWAHAVGFRREDNPHGIGGYHANQSDWLKGWEDEAKRK